MKKLAIFGCCFVVAAGFGLTACDDGGDPSVLQLKVKTVPAEVTYGGASKDPKFNADAARVTITGPGMDDVVKEYPLGLNGSANGVLPDFSEGYDRQATFEFLGAADPLNNNERPVISRGRSSSLDLWRGELSYPVNLFVAPVNSMVPVTHIDDDTAAVVPSVPEITDRVGATVTELDDGRILICGGAKVKADARTWYMPDDLYELTDTCELYDPRNGEFSVLTNRMSVKRAYHQAIKLGSEDNPDGRVVLISGFTVPDGGTIAPSPTIDIYDPETNLFASLTGKNSTDPALPGGAGRALFTADLVNADANYIVLFGGLSNFKSAGGTWDILWISGAKAIPIAHGYLSPGAAATQSTSAVAGTVRYNHSLARVRGFASEVLKDSGHDAYLLIGGENESGVVKTIEPFFILCASRDACSLQRGDQLMVNIQNSARTLASSFYDTRHNIVWIAGGFTGTDLANPTNRVEAYRVSKAGFAKKTDGSSADEHLVLGSARGGMSVVEMDNGEFLFTGGHDGTNRVTSVQAFGEATTIYNGQSVVVPSFLSDFPTMEAPRAGHLTIVDQTGRVMILGGVSTTNASPDPMMYNPAD